MNAIEAFSSTLIYIMDQTDRFCSFGLKLDSIEEPVSAALYGMGKLGKYTLGLVIGIFIASFAYGFTALKNWFSYEKQHKNDTSISQIKVDKNVSDTSPKDEAELCLKINSLKDEIGKHLNKLNERITDLKKQYDEKCKAMTEEMLQKTSQYICTQNKPLLELTSDSSTSSDEDKKNAMQKLMNISFQYFLKLLLNSIEAIESDNRRIWDLERFQISLNGLMEKLEVNNLNQKKVSNISEEFSNLKSKYQLFFEYFAEKKSYHGNKLFRFKSYLAYPYELLRFEQYSFWANRNSSAQAQHHFDKHYGLVLKR